LFIFSTCFGRLCAHHQEKWLYLCDTWYLSHCMNDVWHADSHPYRVTSSTCRIYSYFSWWWAHSRPKHVEKRNKHTKKNCAPSWLYLQDINTLCGQNVEYIFPMLDPVAPNLTNHLVIKVLDMFHGRTLLMECCWRLSHCCANFCLCTHPEKLISVTAARVVPLRNSFFESHLMFSCPKFFRMFKNLDFTSQKTDSVSFKTTV